MGKGVGQAVDHVNERIAMEIEASTPAIRKASTRR
jgi:enolase